MKKIKENKGIIIYYTVITLLTILCCIRLVRLG